MKTFTQRLTVTFAALVTATAAVVLAIGGWLLDREIGRSIEVLHEAEFRELRGLLGRDPTLTPEEINRRLSHDAENDAALYFVQVHSELGHVLFRSPNLGANVLPDLTGRELHWQVELAGIGLAQVSEFHDGPLHVQVASPLEPQRRLVRDYFRIAALLVVGVAGASMAMGYAFSRFTLRPVRAIQATANRIRSDNLSERIPVPAGSDELTALVRLLNQMFDRLQASFEQARRFSADASHELKTPLALIRLNAEKLRGRLAADHEATAAVADILEEISRLNRIIERLLFLAKSESGALQIAARKVSVRALLEPFAEDARVLAEDRGVAFEWQARDEGDVRVDPELLRQLLLNLVANAVSVSPPGGTVRLESAREEDGWRFAVMDEGPGIAPEQLPRLFERFVRLEAPGAEGERRAGHGLGLAICRSIAELHGGQITAANRTDRSGLCVTVTLPGDGDRAGARAERAESDVVSRGRAPG